jgi:hypothetical protein
LLRLSNVVLADPKPDPLEYYDAIRAVGVYTWARDDKPPNASPATQPNTASLLGPLS